MILWLEIVLAIVKNKFQILVRVGCPFVVGDNNRSYFTGLAEGKHMNFDIHDFSFWL
jgi:hypothetical protein